VGTLIIGRYKGSYRKLFKTVHCNGLRTHGEQFSICHFVFQKAKEDKKGGVGGERHLGKCIVKVFLAYPLF